MDRPVICYNNVNKMSIVRAPLSIVFSMHLKRKAENEIVLGKQRTLDDTVLGERIGAGNNGVVYVKAGDESRVIKVIGYPRDEAYKTYVAWTKYPEVSIRFYEAFIGVVPTQPSSGSEPDSEYRDERMCIEIDRVRGPTLHQTIRNTSAQYLDWVDVDAAFLTFFEYLSSDSARFLQHGDMKPDNMMYDTIHKRVVMIDWSHLVLDEIERDQRKNNIGTIGSWIFHTAREKMPRTREWLKRFDHGADQLRRRRQKDAVRH